MTNSHLLPRRPAQGLSVLLALGLAAIALSACKIDDGSADPIAATDYHQRYPIVLAKAPASVDLFALGGRLDDQSRASLRAFAERYRELGAGRFVVLAPSNQRRSPVVAAIRAALRADGARAAISLGSYPNPDPTLVAPFRVMFESIVAKVPARCGDYPTDLASGDDLNEWKNLPYENYGCSTQKALAAQVDDPRDLARARATTEPDVAMRLRAIGDVRQGQDPGTQWKIQNSNIGTVGGN